MDHTTDVARDCYVEILSRPFDELHVAEATSDAARLVAGGGWVTAEDVVFNESSSSAATLIVRPCVPSAAAEEVRDVRKTRSHMFSSWPMRDVPAVRVDITGCSFQFGISCSSANPDTGVAHLETARVVAGVARTLRILKDDEEYADLCGGILPLQTTLVPPRTLSEQSFPSFSIPMDARVRAWAPFDLHHDGDEAAAGSFLLLVRASREDRKAIAQQFLPRLRQKIPRAKFRFWDMGSMDEQVSTRLRLRLGSSCFRMPSSAIAAPAVQDTSASMCLDVDELESAIAASHKAGGCGNLHHHRFLTIHYEGTSESPFLGTRQDVKKPLHVVQTDVLVSCTNRDPVDNISSGSSSSSSTAATAHVEFCRSTSVGGDGKSTVERVVADLIRVLDPDVVSAFDWRPFLDSDGGVSLPGRLPRSCGRVVGGKDAIFASPLQKNAVAGTTFGTRVHGAQPDCRPHHRFAPLQLVLPGRATVTIASMSDHMYRKGDSVRRNSEVFVAREATVSADQCRALPCMDGATFARTLADSVTKSSRVATMLQYAWSTYGVSLGAAHAMYQSGFGARDMRQSCWDEESGLLFVTSPRAGPIWEYASTERELPPGYALHGGFIRVPDAGVWASVDVAARQGGGPPFAGDLKTAYPREAINRRLCPSKFVLLPPGEVPSGPDGDTAWEQLPELDHPVFSREDDKQRRKERLEKKKRAAKNTIIPDEPREPVPKRTKTTSKESSDDDDDDDDDDRVKCASLVAWVHKTRRGVLDFTLQSLATRLSKVDAAIAGVRAAGNVPSEALAAQRAVLKKKSNIIYGSTGLHVCTSPFWGRHVAAHITHGVRSLLRRVVRLLERWGFEVFHVATDGFTAHATRRIAWDTPAVRKLRKPVTLKDWEHLYRAVIEDAMSKCQSNGHRMVLEDIYAGGVISLGSTRLLFYKTPRTLSSAIGWRDWMPDDARNVYSGLAGKDGCGGSGASFVERCVLLRAAHAAICTTPSERLTAVISVLDHLQEEIFRKGGVFSDPDVFVSTISISTPKATTGLAVGDLQGASVVMSAMRLFATNRARPGCVVPLVRMRCSAATKSPKATIMGGSLCASDVLCSRCGDGGEEETITRMDVAIDRAGLVECARKNAMELLFPSTTAELTETDTATSDGAYIDRWYARVEVQSAEDYRNRTISVSVRNAATEYPREMRTETHVLWPAGYVPHLRPVSKLS